MPEGGAKRGRKRGAVIVTGASRGIGAAVAVELEARGFSVWSMSRSGEAPAGRAASVAT